jgi:hypothetical protein
MEGHLKAAARKRGLKGKRAKAFVYGTMRKAGWSPGGRIRSDRGGKKKSRRKKSSGKSTRKRKKKGGAISTFTIR